ncbi:MAG: HigA family addiction module antidote protein [Nitrospinaceae bacterium]|nr:HigA family addiction module antidote protein [Nitrospinaceae bacterium]
MKKKLEPITPGEVLQKEFMLPLGISQNKLARDLDVPVARINDIIHSRRGITANSALRLGKYFKTTAEFWINLQSRYDLKIARRDEWPAVEKNIRPLAQSPSS